MRPRINYNQSHNVLQHNLSESDARNCVLEHEHKQLIKALAACRQLLIDEDGEYDDRLGCDVQRTMEAAYRQHWGLDEPNRDDEDEDENPQPEWWPSNPYPADVFPMTTEEYVVAVPDEMLRTAISGYCGRLFWNIASQAIWDAWCEHRNTGS